MVGNPMDRVLRVLRRAALQGQAVGLSDWQLLERFLARREEAAFEAIVQRHGPMVLSVCRRVLEHAQDAEDAFQATFLVLACKAASILTRETVGNWLYGVAYRTAQKARAAAARRRVKEKLMTRPEAFNEPEWQDLRPLLDQELNSLPDIYREPLVLCDLQGITRKAAAQQLGWSEGTLSGRLSRARELLAKRLKRCGVTLTVAALAGALSTSVASALVPAPLVQITTQAATSVAAGHAVAGVVSAPVAALTKGVLKAMFMNKLKTVSVVLLAVGLIALGAGVSLTQQPGGPPGAPPKKAEGAAANAKADAALKLPKGMPPFQVLVTLNKENKLTVKGGGVAGGAVGGGGAGGGGGGGAVIAEKTYDLKDVKVFDTKGKQIATKDLANLLKEETVAVATWRGQAPDALHVRILREDILIFVLPMPKVPGGGGGGGGFKVPPGAAPQGQ
jgi:RNA polymerase sigma factor (sigma-70 family)